MWGIFEIKLYAPPQERTIEYAVNLSSMLAVPRHRLTLRRDGFTSIRFRASNTCSSVTDGTQEDKKAHETIALQGLLVKYLEI